MSAVISSCGRYRYRLERYVADTGIVVAFFGINCSTADAEVDDHTVMKWRGFAKRMGASKFVVGNPFAFRATDVKELASQVDPIGPANAYYLSDIILEADVLMPCWGSQAKVPPRLRPVIDQLLVCLRQSGKPIYTFGFTASGDPKHPLMLGYDTELVEWI